jgi:hypothetical protein
MSSYLIKPRRQLADGWAFVASVCPPSTFHVLICPEVSKARIILQRFRWQHILRLDPSFELSRGARAHAPKGCGAYGR